MSMPEPSNPKRIVLTPSAKEQKRNQLDPSNPVLLLSPALILIVWELVAQLGLIDVRFFPAPSTVAHTFWQEVKSGMWFYHVRMTLMRVLVGFTVGAFAGILAGVIMGLSSFVRVAVYPLIAAIYPVPKVAIFPLVLLILGIGEASKITTVIASCFFFLAISAMSGVLNIPNVYKDVGKNFGASRAAFITTIALPAAMPAIFSGLRLALGAAFLVDVSIEFVSAQEGIGWLIWHSWELFSLPLMFVGLLTVSFLGLLLTFSLDFVEEKLVPWRT